MKLPWRKSREQRIVDSIFKRIERDVNYPLVLEDRDHWRVVGCHQSMASERYGLEHSLTIELRRVR